MLLHSTIICHSIEMIRRTIHANISLVREKYTWIIFFSSCVLLACFATLSISIAYAIHLVPGESADILVSSTATNTSTSLQLSLPNTTPVSATVAALSSNTTQRVTSSGSVV